jgi:hypothetical protein
VDSPLLVISTSMVRPFGILLRGTVRGGSRAGLQNRASRVLRGARRVNMERRWQRGLQRLVAELPCRLPLVGKHMLGKSWPCTTGPAGPALLHSSLADAASL